MSTEPYRSHKPYDWWDDDLPCGLDSTLYHYTSVAGLTGIVESSAIWATSFAFLNDSSEFQYGLTVFNEAFEELVDTNKISESHIITPIIKEFMTVALAEKVYGCCFSTSGNKLSQWRGYGANGFGFSIGFQAGKLLNITNGSWGARLGRIIYDETKQREYAARVIMEGLVPDVDRRSPLRIPNAAHKRVQVHLAKTAPLFKHPGFAEEDEVRILYNADLSPVINNTLENDVRFDTRSGVLRPYVNAVEGPNGILPIKEIYVGPCNDFGRARYAVELLLRRNGYDTSAIEIIQSQTPYRG